MNLFKNKTKESSKLDLYKGQFISMAQAKEWFSNQFVLLENPKEIQNMVAGGTLLYAHKNRKKVNEFVKGLPRPISLFVCDTNTYEESEEIHIALP
jgi:hypothetical protein